MSRLELSPEQVRVLGCLVEKQRTTPDAYPLTINSLRLACNQATNREPVVEYDEGTVREAAEALGRRRLARLTTGHGGRTAKYRHLAGEALELSDSELAVLAVLMLRGPQTIGELKARGERLHGFDELAEVSTALGRLVGRGYAARLDRRPGQKEQRYVHRLGGADEAAVAEPEVDERQAASSSEGHDPSGVSPGGWAADEDRLARVENEVRELRAALDKLRRELGA